MSTLLTSLAVVRAAAGDQRGLADQCIHAPKAKAQYLRAAADLDEAVKAFEKAIVREEALRAEVESLKDDKERLDWLEAHPLKTEVKGGSEDGSTGTFWGCGSANCTLRETIDTVSALKS